MGFSGSKRYDSRQVVSEILYLKEDDVRQTFTMAEAIEVARRGLEADAHGKVTGDKFYMHLDENSFIKPFSGYMQGEDYAFVKTFTYVPANLDKPDLPTTGSQVLIYESQTGRCVCLMEANWITGLKTGASSVLTAQRLGRTKSRYLVIFGAGLLGEMHLRGLATCFDLERVTLIDIDEGKAQRLAARLTAELGLIVEATPLTERERVVREADLIVTVTTGDQPLIELAWLKPGVFVARLGSYQEIALDVITGADKFVVDRWMYVSYRVPELKQLIASGNFGPQNLHAEWLDIVAGRRPGRESQAERIVYIALGIWGEYSSLLPEVYRRALERGLGRKI
jgi:ornithine cyclodeaminase/alanine dehydrogenase-like protein (mu-crystallin family)